MERPFGLKINFAAKVLPVRVFEPSCNEFFIGDIVGIFEILESDHESGGQSGCAVVFAVEGLVGFIKSAPLYELGELLEGMVGIELLVESGLKELELRWFAGGDFFGLHGNRICKVFGRKR